MRRFGLVMALLAAIIVMGFAAEAKPTDDERLARGEVLVDYQQSPRSKVHDVRADIMLDAAPPLVWGVLTDYENWSRIFPDVIEAKVLDRQEAVTRLKVRLRNVWPLSDLDCVLRVTEDRSNWSVSWDLEQGGLKTLYGSASIKQSADRAKSRLTYVFNRDQGWYMSKSSADLDNRTTVINQLLGLRREVRKRQKDTVQTPDKPEIKPKWKKSPPLTDPEKPGPDPKVYDPADKKADLKSGSTPADKSDPKSGKNKAPHKPPRITKPPVPVKPESASPKN
jgi:hypothetical protein